MNEEYVLKQAGLEDADTKLKTAFIAADSFSRKRLLKKINKLIRGPGGLRSPTDLEAYVEQFIETHLKL